LCFWTLKDKITKHQHKNHKRTKLKTTEQQIWTHIHINTWSRKTHVAINNTATQKPMCKILASFQNTWLSSSNTCWANFDYSTRPFLKFCSGSGSLQTAVWQFRQRNFYYIRRKCRTCGVLWIGDHSSFWSSWVCS
jgi:hypothetical protein